MAEITLRRRETVAEGTVAFYFDKPLGFSHEAGQNALFTLIDPREEDATGPSRAFTYVARKKGEIDYICRLHPVMHGTLIVK